MIWYTNHIGTVAVNEAVPSDLHINEIGHSCPEAGLKHCIAPRNVYVLHYLVKGCGMLNGKKVHSGEGFLLIPGEETLFQIDSMEPWEHYWIMFSGPEAKKLLQLAKVGTESHIFRCDYFRHLRADFDQILNNPSEMPEEYMDVSLYLRSILYRLLSYHAVNKEDSVNHAFNPYVRAALTYIKYHYSEKITVEDIAAAAHITSRYLYKLFRKELGRSPQQVLIEYRIKCAEYLLVSTRMQIGEIACNSGYTDIEQFSSAFRRIVGMTPSQYRSKYSDKL